MKRLYLTVEGQTEAAFANDVLGPHLSDFGVFLFPARFTGPHGRRRGRVPRGGMLTTFLHVLADMRRWLKEDSSPDARFSMMVDLYSLPADFPGHSEGMKQPSGREKARMLQQALASEMNDDRFIPYLQCHEFEALVLVDPLRIGTLYEGRSLQLRQLSEECGRFATAEDINLGQHSHPKYRIKQRVEDYQEHVAGPLLAGDIGLRMLRRACPHFGEWLSLLEDLNNEAPGS